MQSPQGNNAVATKAVAFRDHCTSTMLLAYLVCGLITHLCCQISLFGHCCLELSFQGGNLFLNRCKAGLGACKLAQGLFKGLLGGCQCCTLGCNLQATTTSASPHANEFLDCRGQSPASLPHTCAAFSCPLCTCAHESGVCSAYSL